MIQKTGWIEKTNKEGEKYVRIPIDYIVAVFDLPREHEYWVYSDVPGCDLYVRLCYIDEDQGMKIDTKYEYFSWQFAEDEWKREIIILSKEFCRRLGIDSKLLFQMKCLNGMLHLCNARDEYIFEEFILQTLDCS